tara:strand:+ start:267 stop:842 length:576 start_codon:yes stop_codon:yes gene_type:complete
MKKFLIALIFSWIPKTNLFGAEAGMPQLDPKYWFSQVFWLIIVFTSIYLLIAKIFIPKIKSSIDLREDKIRKDLEEAKNFKEEAEKKLKVYNDLISSGKKDVKKILSENRQKLNEDMQTKRKKIQKEIEKETHNAEQEIHKFKTESVSKMSAISEEIALNLLKDILGEDVNKSSIKATVSEMTKEYKIKRT